MSNRLNHDQVRQIPRPDLVPTVCKCYQQMTLAGIVCFVCFVALRPKSTAMVIAGWSVHLTTLFPGQA